jgi:hypothetical protein
MYYLTNGWVDQYLDELESTQVFVFTDACESGAFNSGLAQNGRIVAAGAAGSGTYTYDAPDLGNGAFTYFLLEGMNMYSDVESAVQHAISGFNAWGNANNLDTHPSWHDGISGDMIL